MLALHRPANPRDIPRPDLLNPSRQQFRLRLTGMPKLVSPLHRCTILFKDPVYGSHRTQVTSPIQQGGMHFPDRMVRKPLTVKGGPNGFPFLGTQRHEEPFWACEGHKTALLPYHVDKKSLRIHSGRSWGKVICNVDKKSLGIHSDPHRLCECSSSHRLPLLQKSVYFGIQIVFLVGTPSGSLLFFEYQ